MGALHAPRFTAPARGRPPVIARAVPRPAAAAVALAAALAAAPPPALAADSTLQTAVAALQTAVADAGPAGPALFAGAYAAAVVALAPASALTLLAGALFGPVLGTAVVNVGATAGATAACALARRAAAPALARLDGTPAWDSLRAVLATASGGTDNAWAGFRLVLLLRLSPAVPFSASNYALGALTPVPLPAFAAATALGSLPATAAYVAAGSAGGRALSGEGAGGGPPAWLLALGAVATLAAVKLVGDAAANELAKGKGEE
jgi:uncharacterized membrane protein YdjX (TVP38/TMEM64 family)